MSSIPVKMGLILQGREFVNSDTVFTSIILIDIQINVFIYSFNRLWDCPEEGRLL